jgi:hypothetical protein
VELADRDADVEVTIPPGLGPVRIPGLRARRAHLAAADRWRRAGVPVTTPEATAVRLAALLPLDDAVAAVDQLIATGVVDLDAVRARATAASGRGAGRAHSVAALSDGLAASPQETRVRLLIGRSSLPAPVAQYRVLIEGRVVARVDFAWPERRVALEYDGLWHAEAGQFARDRERLNLLREAGWTVIFVTAADLYRRERLLTRIALALGV